jgi:hypothetical protein
MIDKEVKLATFILSIVLLYWVNINGVIRVKTYENSYSSFYVFWCN